MEPIWGEQGGETIYGLIPLPSFKKKKSKLERVLAIPPTLASELRFLRGDNSHNSGSDRLTFIFYE